ncbi:MAG: diaminopimelate decarboxylase [Leptolyngbyaceae bacterium]|nr:diaminopimelate decarboxylase [Leptolyngbyaceae bacterium]
MVSIAAPQSGKQYLNPSGSTPLSPNQCLLPLTARVNEQDHLEIGGCDVVELVQRFGSPLYILDETTLRSACQRYRQAFETYYPGESLVLYASKAWNCLAICAIAASEGLGIDVVSGGELLTALEAHVDPQNIYFHGNNKSIEELKLAVDANVTIVIDNWYELQLLSELTENLTRPVSVLLRVTPGIECHTHEYIQTGHLDSKFGFDPDQLEKVFETLKHSSSISCIGLHAHIGSQIFELQPHHDLADVMVRWLIKAKEYGLPVSTLDVGGGLGMKYTEQDDPPSIDEWVKTVCDAVVKACNTHNLPLPKLLSEPGRSIIGPTSVTAYTVGSQKIVPGMRTYITVDGGMSDNPRPITYQSVYRAVLANKMSKPIQETPITLAGKHCESGDIVIKDVHLPESASGDIVTVLGTGAYNYSMASNYNRIPRPAAVLVSDGDASLIIRRETYHDLIRQDQMPSYLLEKH